MAKNINQPPLYKKDAIATIQGWIDPKSGELLVSNKSLDLDEIETNYPNQVKRPIKPLTFEEINNALIEAEFEDEINEELVEAVIEDEIVDAIVEADIMETNIDEDNNTENETVNSELADEIIENELIVDFDIMTKADLIVYAKENFNVVLTKQDNKNTLIEKIKTLDGK